MADRRELERDIAQRLGYSVQPQGRTGYYSLLHPDGSKTVNFGAVWAAWEAVPNYSTDLNAALTLLTDTTWELKGLAPMMYTLTIWDRGIQVAHEMGHTPAQAIVKTWLAWKDKAAQHGET